MSLFVDKFSNGAFSAFNLIMWPQLLFFSALREQWLLRKVVMPDLYFERQRINLFKLAIKSAIKKRLIMLIGGCLSWLRLIKGLNQTAFPKNVIRQLIVLSAIVKSLKKSMYFVVAHLSRFNVTGKFILFATWIVDYIWIFHNANHHSSRKSRNKRKKKIFNPNNNDNVLVLLSTFLLRLANQISTKKERKKIMGFQVMLAQATRFRAPENATAVYDSVSPPNVADEHKPGESKKDENDGMEQHQSLLSFSY